MRGEDAELPEKLRAACVAMEESGGSPRPEDLIRLAVSHGLPTTEATEAVIRELTAFAEEFGLAGVLEVFDMTEEDVRRVVTGQGGSRERVWEPKRGRDRDRRRQMGFLRPVASPC
ncbi:MAG TPA: hypothetical protein VF173_06135 [Thermoanaerobaculia bacterium]|nr:hypothetical protein [Thermoanaerobaculia bacterium]